MEAVLTRESIFASDDTGFESIEVPEWGGTLYVRGLNGLEREEMENHFLKGDDSSVDITGQKVKMLIACVVDKDRNQIFKPNDAGKINKKSGVVIDKIFGVCCRLSGLTDAAIEEIKGN